MCEQVKRPKKKSPERALSALMAICAKAEKSSGDARRLLARWGVEESDRVQILGRLIEMRFIDDRRFAELFVRDKCRLSGWGARRIASELMIKGIDRDIIDKELERLDSDKLKERLGELLERKLRTTKGKNSYEKRGKLLNYGARLGYDYSMMCEVIEQLNFNAEEECDEESLYF